MSDSRIDVEPTGDGITIHLPFRELGGAAKAGWIAIGLGFCIALFMVGWIATPVTFSHEVTTCRRKQWCN